MASGYARANNYRQYDISPDGKRFIMMRSAFRAGESMRLPEIIFVENWAAELALKR
ncbi:hypothetical protein D3C83_304500 [compost metagenome]